jgi:hypothetical protein
MDALVIFLIVAAIYFLPTIIAGVRGKRNTVAIFVLNFLLGWTFIAWVVALVWSVAHEERSRAPQQ